MKKLNLTPAKCFEYLLYVLGVVFMIVGMDYYCRDLSWKYSPMLFEEHRYVGGDAYNYIISAARSAAVMIKSLIWVVLGCSAIIIGRSFSTRDK